MGVYIRRDSPFYWLLLERPNQKALREKTRVLVDAPTAQQRKDQRQLADQLYHDRMFALARGDAGLVEPKTAILFSAFAAWFEAHISAHHRGAEREREILKTLVAAFGPIPLSDLTRAAILEWRTIRAEKVSARTVNREMSVLSRLLTAAVPQHLSVSPMADLAPLRETFTERGTLSRAHERKLLAVLEPADKALVLVALDTLMRLGDALRLEWSHDHGGYLSVMNTKTGRPYKVPVSRRVRRALDALSHHETKPYIFWSRRLAAEKHWRTVIAHMLQDACLRADIPYGLRKGITFHGLRHTGTTRMVAAGIDLRTVQEIGGWASLQQLSRYAHPTDQAKRRAVASVSRA